MIGNVMQTVSIDDLTTRQMVELLIEMIQGLQEQIDRNHEEIVEKLSNLSLPGGDYGFEGE